MQLLSVLASTQGQPCTKMLSQGGKWGLKFSWCLDLGGRGDEGEGTALAGRMQGLSQIHPPWGARHLFLIKKKIFFSFWLHHTACRILVSQPELEPMLSAVGAQSPKC